MKAPDKETQKAMTPEKVLQLLREGNYRFCNNLSRNKNLLRQLAETRDGQFPLATILNCIDSRTPTELIFDQGLGTLFGIRIAGSVISEDVLGSMEFSCRVAGSKLIVVLGHTKCGAVKGACDDVKMGNLSYLLEKIRPSVELEKTVVGDRTSANGEFVDKVAEIHVRSSLDIIQEKSHVLSEMIEKGEIGLVGGMYDVSSGIVNFFDAD